MNRYTCAVRAFLADENGVTAIEYGLIASLIGVAIVTAATSLGNKISAAFDFVVSKLTTA